MQQLRSTDRSTSLIATTIKVSEELRDRINKDAQERGLAASGLIESLLDGHERRRRMEAFGRSVRGADDDYWDEIRLWDADLVEPRTLARERIVAISGTVDAQTMREVDIWLRGFLGLP